MNKKQKLWKFKQKIGELTIKSLNAKKELDIAQEQYREVSKIYHETLVKFDDLENKLHEEIKKYNKIKGDING